jgi:hypothetical protein
LQKLGFAPTKILGVTQPIDTAQDFVLGPLAKLTATNPRLAAALAAYNAAPAAQKMAWANAYLKAVGDVKFVGGIPVVPPAADGACRSCSPTSSRWPKAARSMPTCWRTGRSTAPTSPSRCCS